MDNNIDLPISGNIDQNFIFIALVVAHLAALLSLLALYLYRKRRRQQKEDVIKDTIDALLEEYDGESQAELNHNLQDQPKEIEEIESDLSQLNKLSRREFSDYLGNYFKAADYRAITLPSTEKNPNTPHLIIERQGKKGVILTDQPKTGVTGLPLVRSYYSQNQPKIEATDSLIIITTGSLSPKAAEFCRSLERPITVINGQQLASSIQQMDLKKPQL